VIAHAGGDFPAFQFLKEGLRLQRHLRGLGARRHPPLRQPDGCLAACLIGTEHPLLHQRRSSSWDALPVSGIALLVNAMLMNCFNHSEVPLAQHKHRPSRLRRGTLYAVFGGLLNPLYWALLCPCWRKGEEGNDRLATPLPKPLFGGKLLVAQRYIHATSRLYPLGKVIYHQAAEEDPHVESNHSRRQAGERVINVCPGHNAAGYEA